MAGRMQTRSIRASHFSFDRAQALRQSKEANATREVKRVGTNALLRDPSVSHTLSVISVVNPHSRLRLNST